MKTFQEFLNENKLTPAERAKLKPSQFAGPDRTYPDENRSHAKAAILDAGVSEKDGHISQAEKDEIDRKARAELRRTDKSKK